MSALDHTVLHLRNITKNLNSQFFLQKFLHSRIQHRRHLIKDHTSDMAVFSVFHKSPDISRQRYTHPPAVHDQNNRCICHFGKIIGTGSGCRSRHAVIKSHNAFHDCNLTVLCSSGKEISGYFRLCKKGVQVSGFCSDHPAVEHRIDIVRTTFKGCRFDTTFHKCL